MTFYRYLIITLFFCGLLTSCFKDEPLNAECDIKLAYVHLSNPTDIFYSPNDTLVNVLSEESTVTFYIKEDADLTSLSPIFEITEGATISPESGSTHDFSGNTSVMYKVTSQDGKWTRQYRVRFIEYQAINEFHFEDFRLVDGSNGGQYYTWYDVYPDGTEAENWATANPGFNLSMSSATKDEYPTVSTLDGYQGNGVMLVTRSTGPLGALIGRPIAAGNFYLGYFDLSVALIDQLQATNFGVPFNRKPTNIKVYYKYKAGDTYMDGDGNTIPSMEDKGNIYAVFYRNHDDNGNSFMLHGDDVKTSPNIVAIADCGNLNNVDRWRELNIPFEYKGEVDDELLLNNGYNITVVFTSSFDGGTFSGAIGSTLYVDELTIECEDTW